MLRSLTHSLRRSKHENSPHTQNVGSDLFDPPRVLPGKELIMSIEAMKQALAALEAKDTWGSSIREAKENAITSLRQAIAEAEKQEPFGTVVEYRNNFDFYRWGESPYFDNAISHWVVYTHPQLKREPLTDEQMNAIYRQSFGLTDSRLVGDQIKFVRAIEAAHGIKENT
jgi:hypothetical protein